MTKVSEYLTIMSIKDFRNFSILFRRFRLRAGLATLRELGDLLAEKGIVIEESTFSRWQNASRVPRKRSQLLTMISVLGEKGGIESISEANSWLEAAGLGYLTAKEGLEYLPVGIRVNNHFQVPADLPFFTGRKQLITSLEKSVVSGGADYMKVVNICGPAGIGKTALAVHLAHRLRSVFPDGVLWTKVDSMPLMQVLAKIAYTYGVDVGSITNPLARAELVRSMMADKNALLVFDNLEDEQLLSHLLPNSRNCVVLLTARKKIYNPLVTKEVYLSGLSDEEVWSLCFSILGSRIKGESRETVSRINRLAGGSPLFWRMICQHVQETNNNLDSSWRGLCKVDRIDATKSNYEARLALKLSFDSLSDKARQALVSASILSGVDFSFNFIMKVNRFNRWVAKKVIQELLVGGFVERSQAERYKIHPIIQEMAKNEGRSKKLYRQILKYFSSWVEKRGPRGNVNGYSDFEVELGNIISLFKRKFMMCDPKAYVKVWEIVSKFLWDRGYWNELVKGGEKWLGVVDELNLDRQMVIVRMRDLSWLHFWRGELHETEVLLSEGLMMARKLGDQYLIAQVRKKWGYLMFSKKKYDLALKAYNRSLADFKKLRKLADVIDSLTYIGHVWYKLGDTNQAGSYYLEALELVYKLKARRAEGLLLTNLGNIARIDGKFREARRLIGLSQEIDEELDLKDGSRTWNLYRLCLLDQAEGNFKKAEVGLQKVVREFKQFSMLWVAQEAQAVLERVRGKRKSNPSSIW